MGQNGLKAGVGGGAVYPVEFLHLKNQEESSTIQSSPAYVWVRQAHEIPPSLLAYFKFHPKEQRPLSKSERHFYAQVYLHEIEEGSRLLAKYQHGKQARVLSDFKNSMHPQQRLEMMRQLLAHPSLQNIPPEASGHHKIRHNQSGAIQSKIGPHFCLAYTDAGSVRKTRNEDALLVMPNQQVLAIADGMGGHRDGHTASCVAIDFFEAAIHQGLSLVQAIVQANEALLLRQSSKRTQLMPATMGSTLTALGLQKNILHVAHMGDTKALVLRQGKLIWESQDHTKGQELFREGLVDETTALELNHILSRCLGEDSIQPERDVEFSQIPLLPGDRILMMSDGITDNFFTEGFHLLALIQLIKQMEAKKAFKKILTHCQKRLRLSKLPNGRPPKPDNISLALIDYQG